MKKIGILLRDSENKKCINKEIVNYLDGYDVVPIGIIYNDDYDFNKVIEVINLCDGVIMSGGDEILELDLKLARYLYDIDKPTLGICLGMQEMAISINGKIDKLDILNHYSKDEYVHYVRIKKDTKLYEILSSEVIKVNSRHKYSVISTKLSVNAYSKDCVIEGVEDKNKKFYIGIQWHPESIKDDISSKLLIEEFIRNL